MHDRKIHISTLFEVLGVNSYNGGLWGNYFLLQYHERPPGQIGLLQTRSSNMKR